VPVTTEGHILENLSFDCHQRPKIGTSGFDFDEGYVEVFFFSNQCSLQESKIFNFCWDQYWCWLHLLPYNFLSRMGKIVEQQHHVLFLYSFRYFFTKNQMSLVTNINCSHGSCSCSIILFRLVQKTGIDIFNKALKFVYSFNCIFIFFA
jgi:hypothetical protein